MKRITAAFFLMLCLGISTTVLAKSKAIDHGFSLITTFGLPSEDYGLKSLASQYSDPYNSYLPDSSISHSLKHSFLFGLKLGNRWYIVPGDHFGAGIKAYWLDVSFARKKDIHALYEETNTSLNISLLQVGPIITIGLTDLIAIDAYYNIRPTLMTSFLKREEKDEYSYNQNSINAIGFGLTHAIGGCFRFSVLTIGAEYVFGNIDAEIIDGPNLTNPEYTRNTLRILLGLKF